MDYYPGSVRMTYSIWIIWCNTLLHSYIAHRHCIHAMLCSLKWNSMLPGVSTTFTRLPSSFTTDSSWHVAVIDESERCDLKSFNPKMLFPVALFPFPVLPTNTTVVAVAATGSHSFVRLSSERSSSSEVCSGTHSDGAASKFEPPMVVCRLATNHNRLSLLLQTSAVYWALLFRGSVDCMQ